MAAKLVHGNRDIARLVEKQLRNWELSRQQRPTTEVAVPQQAEDFVCISSPELSNGARAEIAFG